MAGELVAGSFLSSLFGGIFNILLSSEVVNWFRGKKLDQKLLGRLKITLEAAHVLLNDAEQRQIKEKAVKDWLDSLEDAAYAADDLLDEVSTKAATQKDTGNNLLSSFLNSQDREMVSRMEDITDTLESIVKQKDTLGLKEIPKENLSWRTTSSLVDISNIYGRDEDKEAITKLLLDNPSDRKISVIPLVGMGGIGKTTLAQLVYNDDKLEGKFDFKVWVCVGENFDVLKMTKIILEAKTSNSCKVNDLDQVQVKLKDELMGKRFLVVLDDMWHVNFDEWIKFQNPFQHGSEGSKMIVTTRNDNDASVVQTIQPYKLKKLSDDHCWLVFAKHASLSPGSQDYSSLEEVGKKIVEKCKGLPLAAQTLGGLLRTKHNVRDWNKILKSEIWKFSENESKILPALEISYHYLPSHLKRCFVFCSLYPKDHQFDRDELVLLWMAEDLLKLSESGSNIEDFGYDCFNGLASRSFFQPSNINENLFVMHDLMHDLAIFYAGKFYFRASQFGSTTDVDLKARHLSYDVPENNLVSKFLETVDSLKHARTLLQFTSFFDMFEEFPQEIASSIPLLLSQMKCLRVLCFKGIPLDSMPSSIGDLIHLRYFDLSKALIKTLPESLSNLYNLQTLKLRNCGELKMLPSRMQDLVNLRHLDIRGTCLEEIPAGMNQLKDLRFLSDYIVGHNVNTIREFGELTNLHGSLVIRKLENVSNSREASYARMSDKEHIDDLKFIWSWSPDNVDLQTEKDIFENLKPCTEVKKINVSGYRGEVFPDWLGQSSYRRLTVMTLSDCQNCCKLPSLGQLPHLKRLEISRFDKLTSIGAEFYKNDHETPFPSLETLALSYLRMWQVWHSSQFDAAFPKLKLFSILCCPMLTGNLPNHLPALEELRISLCGQLDCSLPSAPNILQLSIYGNSEVRFQELPSLRSLLISECSSAISFPGACMPVSLQHLEIKNCKKLEFAMPQQQQQQESLQSLTIHDSCDSLTSFPLVLFPNLMDLDIQGCVNMKCLEVPQSKDDAAFPKLKKLSIGNCPLLKGDLPNHLPDLKELHLWGCKQLNCSLPGAPNILKMSIVGEHKLRLQELPLSLCSLSLEGSQLVESTFEAITHTQLTCLQSLSISDYSSARSFPGACMPSLQHLEIKNCKKLEFAMQQQQQQESLQSLTIRDSCDSLTSFPLAVFPNLKYLKIRGCVNMKCLEVRQSKDDAALPPSLSYLGIKSCPSFVSLLSRSSQNNDALPSLRRLKIRDCGSFVSFSTLGKVAPQLEDLIINDCPEIDSFGEGGGDGSLPPTLRELVIDTCEKLVRCLASSTVLHSCRSLTRLDIDGACDSVKSFPREGCLAASLENLSLKDIPSLETLDCKGLLHLTSLQYLLIRDCPELENIVGERMPASLEQLWIFGSPLLGERCREKDPQIWPKISHIPDIHVDGRRIFDTASSSDTDTEERKGKRLRV